MSAQMQLSPADTEWLPLRKLIALLIDRSWGKSLSHNGVHFLDELFNF